MAPRRSNRLKASTPAASTSNLPKPKGVAMKKKAAGRQSNTNPSSQAAETSKYFAKGSSKEPKEDAKILKKKPKEDAKILKKNNSNVVTVGLSKKRGKNLKKEELPSEDEEVVNGETAKKRPAKRKVAEKGEGTVRKELVSSSSGQLEAKVDKKVEKQKHEVKKKATTKGVKATVKDGGVAGPSNANIHMDAFSSSGSEDEWEDVEDGDEDIVADNPPNRSIEITIKRPQKEDTEENKWAKFLRQEVNRRIKERQLNCHKAHLLCYIAHLRIWSRALIRSEFLSPLCLSLIPEGYVNASETVFDVTVAARFVKWFRSAFIPAKKVYIADNGYATAQVERLERLINDKVYETDKDLASILFLCFFALKQSVRLCLSCQPIRQRLCIKDLFGPPKSEKSSNGKVENGKGKRKSDSSEETSDGSKKRKSEESSREKESSKKAETAEETGKSGKTSKKKRSSTTSKAAEDVSVAANYAEDKREYWVEFWDDSLSQWICVDPLLGTVDSPESIEANTTAPMHYVIAIDQKFGMRDVTARYASNYLKAEMRRLRVDSEWWTSTLQPYRSKNRARERIENVTIHDYLMAKPMPATIAELKNHPLYVLKKDLLKFEAIYPEDQQPIGKVRGVDVFPRSSVHRLQGSLNWIKEARSVKAAEKPYKVVKARPNMRVPEELRQPRTLDVYGFWQTEPYVPPKVENGRIARNEHGNIYLYKKEMLPEGCVYLPMDGVYGIARRLDLEAVPAVVGWEFHKCGNHPVIEGCVVLAKDEKRIRDAWKEHYEKKHERAKQKRRERAVKNWRRLVKGVLLMKKVRRKFLGPDSRNVAVDEQLGGGPGDGENGGSGELAPDDGLLAWPPTRFELPLATEHKSDD